MKVKMHQSYLWIEIPIHEMSPLDYNSAPKSSFHSVIDNQVYVPDICGTSAWEINIFT